MISFKYTGLYREPDKFTRHHDCLSKNAPLGWQVCVWGGGGGGGKRHFLTIENYVVFVTQGPIMRYKLQSIQKGNDQELIQSNPISTLKPKKQ